MGALAAAWTRGDHLDLGNGFVTQCNGARIVTVKFLVDRPSEPVSGRIPASKAAYWDWAA
jgi:hypothetical protein